MRASTMMMTVALLVVGAPQALADDDAVQERLRRMQERMMALEDKLQSTTDQLDAASDQVREQKQVMSNAGLEVEADATASGVDSFLQSLEISGWINISYWHNFNDPTNGECPDEFAVFNGADDDGED